MNLISALTIVLAWALVGLPCSAIDHGSDVASNETWSPADNPHRIISNIRIRSSALLTVLPGCDVTFVGGTKLTVEGRLSAQGEQATVITWRSDQASPQPGDWQTIIFDTLGGNSVLRYCDIRHGGGDSARGMLHIMNDEVTIERCTFGDCSNNAIRTNADQQTTVTDCLFEAVAQYPISVQAAALPTIDEIIFADCPYPFIEVRGGSLPSGQNVSWNAVEPAYLLTANFSVQSGATLTLPAGIVLKFTSGIKFSVSGSLVGSGTETDQVIFTSSNDAAHGGYTSAAQRTEAQPGDWAGLSFEFQSSSNSLHWCTVLYAGADPAFGAVYCRASTTQFANCEISYSNSVGLNIIEEAAPMVTACKFHGNEDYPIAVQASGVAALSNNEYTENLYQAINLTGGSPSSSGAVSWANQGVPYAVTGLVEIKANHSVTVAEGTIFKFAGSGQFQITGKLTAIGTLEAPVVFTSILDDAFGGDTNADESATSPAPGDWLGLKYLTATGDAGKLQYCRLLYGGSVSANVQVDKIAPEIKNCWISHSGADGVFYGNSTATQRISYCNITDNLGLGVNHFNAAQPVDTVNAANNWWGDATGPYDPSGADGRANVYGAGEGVSDWVMYEPWLRSPFEINNSPPFVQLAGYWDTHVSQSQGGNFILLAYVTDPDGQGDIDAVTFYVSGVPAGMSMFDDGTNGDWVAGDSIYTFAVQGIPSGATPNDYLLTIKATDRFNQESGQWPFLTVNSSASFGQPPTLHSWKALAHEWMWDGPDSPVIAVGGYFESTVTYEDGGTFTLYVYPTDPNGDWDVADVELYYDYEPTGVFFPDGFSLTVAIPPATLYPAQYLLQAVAIDYAGNRSTIFPHFTIVP